MTDPLKGLKEKMVFDEDCRILENAAADKASKVRTYQTNITDSIEIFKRGREDGFIFGAEYENARLQSVVLKEVGELVEALEFYASGNADKDLEPRPEKAHLYANAKEPMWSEIWKQRSMSDHWSGKRARQALAKFKGGV